MTVRDITRRLNGFFDSPRTMTLGVLCCLLMAAWALVGNVRQDSAAEQRRVEADVASCESGNAIRGEIRRLAETLIADPADPILVQIQTGLPDRDCTTVPGAPTTTTGTTVPR